METEIVFCFVFVDGNQFQYQYIENSIIMFFVTFLFLFWKN